MEIYKRVILGLIQGLTEFLPISSSGHLVLFCDILNVEQSIEFDLMLHFGTLLSVVAYYFRDIISLIFPPNKKLLYLIIATIPAGLVMLFFGGSIESAFSTNFLPIGFMITAIILFITDNLKSKNKQPTAMNSLFIGLFQGLAVFPGISRSGMTSFGGLMAGLSREEAVNFSFLMSIPVIIGSIGGNLIKNGLPNIDVAILSGVAAAFVSGLLAIKIMVKVFKNARLKFFSLYLVLLSIAILALKYHKII